MAAFSHHRAGSRVHHGGDSSSIAAPELPGGCCNFRDLRPGASATSCGCKRFWLNEYHYTGNAGPEKAWCFCGHHACFHSYEASGSASTGSRPQYTQNVHQAPPQGYAPAPQPALASPKRIAGLGIRSDSGSQSQSQSINTRIWDALNGFARQQEDGNVSDVPSTAAPSVTDESRCSPAHVGQRQSQAQRSMRPPVAVPQNTTTRPSMEDLSATEVNTPSMAGTPDFRAPASSSSQMRPSPGHLEPERFINGHPNRGSARAAVPKSPVPPPPTRDRQNVQTVAGPATNEVQNLLQAYGRRLDLLESLSFSHVPAEELQERFENCDARILDLEHWRAERDREREQLDNAPSDPSAAKRRRLDLVDTESFSSDRSFDSGAAAHTEAVVMATLATNAITDPRIEALENRVTDLENAGPPSFARPWQIQVVLLPWGRDLRGIWFSSMDATQRSLKSATQDEWSGAQSLPKLSFQSTDSAGWTTDSIQAWADEAHNWLSPKACGPSGAVFQRLASRGLVQDITLTASDSRHVLGALKSAFGNVLRGAEEPSDSASSHRALSEAYIPLRKIRKSSRLRFLTPAEMVTSAIWDTNFLDASVFMKVGEGQRRLYLTTPDAYLQTANEGWSWPTLRHLPLFDASASEQDVQASGSAIEACWTYNENLDRVASAHSSFASHASPWNVDTPGADHDMDDAAASVLSGGPRHHRTVSLPSSSLAASTTREEVPKRRVASFETAGMVPIHADDHGLEVQAKRRRISISPEAERRGVNFTPRWSREPPSPFTSEAAIEARSQGASSRNLRGTTPFAYATPHSNSQYVGRPGYFGGDGDTEADTDLGVEQSAGAEEEWEGVVDGPGSSPAADDRAAFGVEDEVDEDEGDEEYAGFGAQRDA